MKVARVHGSYPHYYHRSMSERNYDRHNGRWDRARGLIQSVWDELELQDAPANDRILQDHRTVDGSGSCTTRNMSGSLQNHRAADGGGTTSNSLQNYRSVAMRESTARSMSNSLQDYSSVAGTGNMTRNMSSWQDVDGRPGSMGRSLILALQDHSRNINVSSFGRQELSLEEHSKIFGYQQPLLSRGKCSKSSSKFARKAKRGNQ